MTAQAEAQRSEEERVLVPLLVALTVVTGTVDSVSILRLGHIFVANMTGNVVFLGFAVAGARGFSMSASLVALGAFFTGAAVAGRLPLPSRRRALARTAAGEALLCATATGLMVATGGTASRYVVTVLLGMAMGGQNGTVRRLAVADLTTTVLTLTLTGLAGDRPDPGGRASHLFRRVASVASMLAGAAVGAVLVLDASAGWALGLATGLLVVVTVRAQWGERWP